MTRPDSLQAAILLSFLLVAAALGAQGTSRGSAEATLYVNRIVVAEKGDIGLGMLVHTAGTVAPAAQEGLTRSVTVLGDAVQYLPVGLYMPQVEMAFGADAIVVGSRTILIPKGTTAEGQSYLLDRLGDFLAAQGLVNNGKVELAFTQTSLKGAAPQDGTPTCQVVKTQRGVEVSFALTASNGDAVSGRVMLPSPQGSPDDQRGVKPNAAVRVVFRKGPITVEMPGRALASASLGETVGVYIADSQKTFSGRVIDGKAVQVDLR